MGRSDFFDPVRIFNTNCRTAHRVLANASCTSTLLPGPSDDCVWFHFGRWKCRGATPEDYLTRCQNEDKRIVARISIPG